MQPFVSRRARKPVTSGGAEGALDTSGTWENNQIFPVWEGGGADG